jgi:hypothetical protein
MDVVIDLEGMTLRHSRGLFKERLGTITIGDDCNITI